MNTNDPTLPNFVRPEAAEVKDDLDLICDLLQGTRRMQEQAQVKKYIFKWPDEKDEIFNIRRRFETVFEGLSRVLSASVGMLFAQSPHMEWNAAETAMKDQYANLDAMGTNGSVLCKRFADKSIAHGIGLILVDHTPAPTDGTVVTAANETELGLRPTWAIYERCQVLSWRTEVVSGAQTMTQLVLEESSSAPDGKYGTKAVKRYRVLELLPTPDGRVATWELWEETKETGKGGFVRVAGPDVFQNAQGKTLARLPIAIAYTGRTDHPLCSTLPLLGVAWANLAHWRLSTTLAFSREIAGYAQAVIVGELAKVAGPNGTSVPGKVKIGPMAAIHFAGSSSGVQPSFEWKAPPVEAFAPLENGIKDKLDQISRMGMSFMSRDTRQPETAEAKRLDATAENSTLATAAQGIEDAWNAALEIHAWYLGIEKAGAPVVTINKDFDAINIDAPTMVAYVQAVKDAGLPPRLLLEAWQQGGRIAPETDLDTLEAEMAANAQAAADQAQALAEAQAKTAQPGQLKPAPLQEAA